MGLDYLTLDRAAGSLSGGEAQRIRLATQIGSRLVGVLYILDEPTAHLDAQSEYEIFLALRELVENKTTILVSHRFTTARMADRIFVMDEGRVVETGTHLELMRKGGLYKELYSLHQSAFSAQNERSVPSTH